MFSRNTNILLSILLVGHVVALPGCAVVFRSPVSLGSGNDLTGSALVPKVPTSLRFSGAWYERISTCSPGLTLSLLDQLGTPIPAPDAISITLSGMTSVSLYDENDPTCSGAPLVSTSLAVNESSRTFYFRSTSTTTETILASTTDFPDTNHRVAVGDEMAFATPESAALTPYGSATSFTVDDFDGDGVPDVISSYQGAGVVFFKGRGTRLDDGVTRITLPNLGFSPSASGITSADFNGDGKKDLAIVDYSNDRVHVYLGGGDGTFSSSPSFTSASIAGIEFGNNVIATDLNGDSRPDMIVTRASNQSIRIFLGNGDGTFSAATHALAGCETRSTATGFFNADTIPDLAVTCYSSNEVQILLGVGDGTFTAGQLFAVGTPTGSNASRVSVARMEGAADTTDDLVVTLLGSNASPVAVVLGNGDGTFGTPTRYASTGLITPSRAAIGDFDGDGDLDVAVTFKSGSGQLKVYRNDGFGGLTLHATYGAGALEPNNPNQLIALDMDGDGELDLVCDNDSGSLGITIFRGLPQ